MGPFSWERSLDSAPQALQGAPAPLAETQHLRWHRPSREPCESDRRDTASPVTDFSMLNALRQSCLFLGLLALLSCAHAHEHMGAPTSAELGVVSFQTSCKPKVQSDFNRGVALLHSFWHEEARRAFEKVATADPDCAMAYWGEAMASFHLYSSTPTAADLAAGQESLAKADAASETSARESAYIHAVHVLYEGYKPLDHLIYEQRFADAMRELASAHPRDLDASAFYALALLASDPPDDVALANAKTAVAILYPLFRKHPEHPGLAHYIIHACDHPQMAQQGLEAARRYASIAPAAPHALHMPSHIFARLGLWSDDIRSNLASKAASERTDVGHIGAENRLHAMEFLEYAYLQRDQTTQARAIVAEAQTIKSSETAYADYYLSVEARFPALFAIETRDWAMAASLAPVPGAHWYSEGQTLLAHAMAAGHMNDAEAGNAAEERFKSLLATTPLPALPVGSSSASLRDEIYAWAAFARKDADSALGLLRPVADRQAQTGKGEVELPAREMLAEMLLLQGRASESLAEYQLSLRSDPNRLSAVLGATKAAEAAGQRAVAGKYERQMLKILSDAN